MLQELNVGRCDDGLELVYSFHDDLILAGEQNEVAGAFHFLKDAASQIGLTFNPTKCEIIPAAGRQATLNKGLFPADVTFLEDCNFELLGGPIGSAEYCNLHTQGRVDKAIEPLSALGELPDPQVALMLLRHYASFGKLVYFLCVVPYDKHKAALLNYDIAVRECIESFLSCSFTDMEWTLANLSTKMGGLGLRSVECHSSAAFLASQASCHDFCSRLDSKYTWDTNDIRTDSYSALCDYNTRVEPNNKLLSIENTFPRQQTLSQAIDSQIAKTIHEESQN